VSTRLRRRRTRGSYSISKFTHRYAMAMVWLIVAIGLLVTSGVLAQFLPEANPVVPIAGAEYEIPVNTIGQIVISFIGLFALFKFIQLVGIRV